MYSKYLHVAIIAFLVLQDVANGKKSKRNKRPPVEDEDSTPQPNVVAYSTFGFNDVGSYDGFVPSSPDYASFLTGVNQESTTRLYAPAFPTALEATGFENNYESLSLHGQAFKATDDGGQQSSMLEHPQSSMNFYNTPTLDTTSVDNNKNTGSVETLDQNANDEDAPVYGAKIGSTNKIKTFNEFNNTEYNVYNSAYPSPSDDNRYLNFPDVQSSHADKPITGESSNAHYQNEHNFVPTYSSTGIESFMKPMTSNKHSQIKFPKVVDFTNSKQYYPTAYDNNPTIPRPLRGQNYFSNIKTDNSYMNPYDDTSNTIIKPTPTFKDVFYSKINEEVPERDVGNPSSLSDQRFLYNYAASLLKNNTSGVKPYSDHKRKLKRKPWISLNNQTNTSKYSKDATTLKSYAYSTNKLNMGFKNGLDETKKPASNTDEIEPASSNLIDLSDYKFTDGDYSSLKKIPAAQDEDEDYTRLTSFYNPKFQLNDYTNPYKSLLSTAPTTTSFWGNVYKPTDYTPFKHQPKTHQYNDDANDEVVNIPKKPYKFGYGKPLENKPSDWYYGNHSPYRSNKPVKDRKKEVSTRYKSEEDLLGLRNHDTSHPSYLPTFNPTYTNDESAESFNDYKKLIEKWRQSYLKSKYKDSVFRDYEGFATETKPLHIPVPKPYPIEIPHPVIVPVPQPYPVRVPVSRPVAVPVIRELTIPIEKPVPYPVFKKVPYPVEKLVPVPVEKEVPVPVEKPYPVHIPYIRPVFHHTRPTHDDYESDHEDDDYKPRPEGSRKNVHYRRRPYSSRNRARRPTRSQYQDRNRRRWPDRHRPSVSNIDLRHKSPSDDNFPSIPYKYREFESEVGDDHSNYLSCKRTGNC